MAPMATRAMTMPSMLFLFIGCDLQNQMFYMKELNNSLSSFCFRCGLYLNVDMSSQPVAVICIGCYISRL